VPTTTSLGGFQQSALGGFVRSPLGARDSTLTTGPPPPPPGPRVAVLDYSGGASFPLQLAFLGTGIAVESISFAADLSPYTMIVVTFGTKSGDYTPLYADAGFNGRLKTWLANGGRLYTNAGAGPCVGGGILGSPPDDMTPGGRAALNQWLSDLGCHMQVRGGRVDNAFIFTFPPGFFLPGSALPAKAAVASLNSPPQTPAVRGTGFAGNFINYPEGTWFGEEFCVIDLPHGSPLYQADRQLQAALDFTFLYDGRDVGEPDNRVVAALEQVGHGYLLLNGNYNSYPGLPVFTANDPFGIRPPNFKDAQTGRAFLSNASLFRNYATWTNEQLTALL
jgi:hypothetical protein